MDILPIRIQVKIKINKNTGCWDWLACLDKHGYGRLMWRKEDKWRCQFSHRVVFQLLRGQSPPELDHLCRNHKCCNPDHLESVSHKVNMQRGKILEGARVYFDNITHCPKGHPYSGDNLYIFITKKGYRNRMCRICRRESKRMRRANGAID